MKYQTRFSYFLLLLGCTLSITGHAQQRPNIVFILADDLAQADLGCYGNPYNETPNIDKLAKRGMLFTDAYSASPVCSPSRAAILTGKHPARLKLTNFIAGNRTDSLSPVLPARWQPFLPSSEITLAQRLQKLNYTTGMVGKWHLGNGDSLAPWNRGFDFARMIGKNGLDYYNYGVYEGSFNKMFNDTGSAYLTDKLTEYAVDFLRTTKKEKPFFLYMCYSAPHVFIVPRGDKVSKYLRKYEKFEGKYNPYYGAMLESMDDGVGQIMAELERQGIADNTLIVFTSDNGGVGLPELGPIPTSAGVLRKWKGHTFEGGSRVPTLISWPHQIAAGSVSQQYITNTDYTPTFLELLGEKKVDLPDAMSFYPVLKDAKATMDRGAIFWHYPHFSNQMGRPSGAVRMGDWKLVKSYETNESELFNLKEDLSETTDLSKKFPAKAKELLSKLDQWNNSVDANMPIRK